MYFEIQITAGYLYHLTPRKYMYTETWKDSDNHQVTGLLQDSLNIHKFTNKSRLYHHLRN